MKKLEYSTVIASILNQVGDPANPPSFAVVNDVLFISTADGLKVYADSEDALASAKMSDAMRAELGRRVPALDFDGAGLAHAFEYVANASGIVIEVDWAALKAAGVGRDAPVHLPLKNISIGQALCIIVGGVKAAETIGITVRRDKFRVGSNARTFGPG